MKKVNGSLIEFMRWISFKEDLQEILKLLLNATPTAAITYTIFAQLDVSIKINFKIFCIEVQSSVQRCLIISLETKNGNPKFF